MGSGFVGRHLPALSRRVRQDLPVQLTLIAFPFKAPNPLKVGQRTVPDLAEMASLRVFATMHDAVCSVYPPGLEIVVIHDGTYLAEALEVPIDEVLRYTEYFQTQVRAIGVDRFVRCESLDDLLSVDDSDRRDFVPPDLGHPLGGEPADALRKTLGMLNLRDMPVAALASLMDDARGDREATMALARMDDALRHRVMEAMAKYAWLDAFLHRFDPRPSAFPDAVHATTKGQPGRLALWLVRRGRGILPWHGVGVLRTNGHVSVEYASEIEASNTFRPIFFEAETTPFCYVQTAAD
jgi:hypothetical protein